MTLFVKVNVLLLIKDADSAEFISVLHTNICPSSKMQFISKVSCNEGERTALDIKYKTNFFCAYSAANLS